MEVRITVEERLADAITSSYESGNYSGTVIDAIHVLGDLILSKSGLDLDGNALIGTAFGGSNPPIRVNSLQTESDKEEQKGIEQLIRGLYTGIRNPRSHAKKDDSLETAHSLIVLVDYLIRRIQKGRSPYDVESIIEQAFDEHFAPNDTYANLLVNDIPPLKRFDVLMQVFQRRLEGKGKNVSLFCNALLPKLTEAEQKEFWAAASDELRTANADEEFRCLIQITGKSNWNKLSEIARVRTENRLIKSVGVGKINRKTRSCVDGALGTWAQGLAEKFTLRSELAWAFKGRLDSPDSDVRGYFYEYCFFQLRLLWPEPRPYVIDRLKQLLAVKDAETYDALSFVGDPWEQEDEWVKALETEYKRYMPPSDDDVPF